MNYNFIMKLLDFFKIEGTYKAAKISLFFSIAIGLMSYNLVITYRIADPDTIIEGLTYYINATWAIVGCGRWLLPIINSISGNIIIPLFCVTFYTIGMWLSAFIISKTWDIKNTFIITVVAIVMTVTPSTIIQMVATYMSCDFALACIFSSIFTYLCFKKQNLLSYLLSIIFIVLSLAAYQSYISYAACLSLLTICIKCLKQDVNTFKSTIKAISSALVGCIVYLLSNKIILKIFNLSSSSRLANVTLSNFFDNFSDHIYNVYYSFVKFFCDKTMNRRVIYFALFIILIFLFILIIISKNINRKNKLLFFILIPLIPVSANVVSLITPDNPITVFMTYQYILLVPFILYLSQILIDNFKFNFIKNLCLLLSIVLTWTNIVSANATYQCYKMTYDYTYNQYSQVIYDIQHNENYIKDTTPVIIAGFFEDDTLRNNIKTYNYAIELNNNLLDNQLFNNLVFWEDKSGVTFNRQRYILQYFGLDFKDISYETYHNIIETSDFASMPIWPNNDSIKLINNYLVVKIDDNYIK